MRRRDFLARAAGTAAAALASPLAALAAPAPAAPEFTFLFLTDSHTQPELGAAEGTRQCYRRARELRSDFALQGGDHVFDSLGVPPARASLVFDLYEQCEQELGLKVHHTVGNHDCFGVYPASGVSPSDPLYGKKMFAQRFGPPYYSFDHKGVHFLVLDSIFIRAERTYEGRIAPEQVDWLAADLKSLAPGTPIILTTHIPLVTAFQSYIPAPAQPLPYESLRIGNSAQVLALLAGHNLLGVLQGHTHVNEVVQFGGVPYITGGAVCGNWWKGTRMGTPEGFTVCEVSGGRLTTRYETFGWKARAA
jgi:DNA repair exonuclease SbcCD nuclease subunit